MTVDHFDDQYSAEPHEPLGLTFDEDSNFFHPEEVPEDEFQQSPVQEESIYTDDPVRVYLREMGAVPLLTREGEVDLARRMERGKLRMQKAISRSALIQNMVLEWSEQLKTGETEIDDYVDLGEVEEGTAADNKRRNELKSTFVNFTTAHKKYLQTIDKMGQVPPANKKLRKKWNGKILRSRVEISRALRGIPFTPFKWRLFMKEIERTVEELNHLHADLKKTDEKKNAVNEARARELKREVNKRETAEIGRAHV